MDPVTAASVADVLRRLRRASDEFSDVRCGISHGLKEITWDDLNYEFGSTFHKSSFKALANLSDGWDIFHYFSSEQDEFLHRRGQRPNPSDTDKRYKRIQTINESLITLSTDALWLANDLAFTRITTIPEFDERQFFRSYSTWMWLVFHAAWSLPRGSVLRAGKYFPTALVARIRLEKHRASEVGIDSLSEEYAALRKAIALRNREMGKDARQEEWSTFYQEAENESKSRLLNNEYMSLLPFDPFTASAALLEILALTPLDEQLKLINDRPSGGALDGLSTNEKLVFEVIEQKGPILGKNLAKLVPYAHSTLRRHVIPKLKPHGVVSGRDGYRVAPRSAT